MQRCVVQARRSVWASFQHIASYGLLCVAARHLLSLHATSCAPERNRSLLGNIYSKLRSRLEVECADKLAFLSMRSKQLRSEQAEHCGRWSC